MVLVSACGGSDDADTGSTAASVGPSPVATVPDTASTPSPETTTSNPPRTTGPTASSTTDSTGGVVADGAEYREVGAEALLQFGADGTTQPIDDPLDDGIYFAPTYALTEDGTGIRFDLARASTTEACITALGTVPSGTVDEFDCYGGSLDTSSTAQIELATNSAVPVILVSMQYDFLEVSTGEFARLLRGGPAGPDAPAGFEYQPYWAAMVEIADGAIVRVNQFPTS